MSRFHFIEHEECCEFFRIISNTACFFLLLAAYVFSVEDM